MKKIPKMRGVLRDYCYETCRNIPQKTPMIGLPRRILEQGR